MPQEQPAGGAGGDDGAEEADVELVVEHVKGLGGRRARDKGVQAQRGDERRALKVGGRRRRVAQARHGVRVRQQPRVQQQRC